MKKKKKSVSLKALMLKDELKNEDFESHLAKDIDVMTYPLNNELNINGKLFVKKQDEKEPKWLKQLQELSSTDIADLKNTSSSAVLFVRTEENVFAFTFGYGRFLINQGSFIQDFGMITALNTLNHESLRSIDLHTFEDQPIQKRSQVTKASNINTFGIDISKDILRAVTGMPNNDVKFRNISGGDAVYSFSFDMFMEEIRDTAYLLENYYTNQKYKNSFSWVDNIKKIKLKKDTDNLEQKLFLELKNKNPDITVHVPEIIDWDDVLGFSFTRSKDKVKTILDIKNYYDYNDENYSLQIFMNDRLHVFNNDGSIKDYSLSKSIYFEVIEEDITYILFAGTWYEIENTFMGRINEILSRINNTDLDFPSVYEYKNLDKSKSKQEFKLEREDDYNERTSNLLNCHLMDKKLVKSNRTTTSIEVCDLLTEEKQLIHVKHKKGGSAGLSHLFAQGNVSAEILLGDKDFRKETRKVLRKIDKKIENLIPLDNLKSHEYEIVYLILGEDSSSTKDKLPFFSKVNLTKAFENLTQKGFKVSIGSVEKERK